MKIGRDACRRRSRWKWKWQRRWRRERQLRDILTRQAPCFVVRSARLAGTGRSDQRLGPNGAVLPADSTFASFASFASYSDHNYSVLPTSYGGSIDDHRREYM
jgi:hypothetical protein